MKECKDCRKFDRNYHDGFCNKYKIPVGENSMGCTDIELEACGKCASFDMGVCSIKQCDVDSRDYCLHFK